MKTRRYLQWFFTQASPSYSKFVILTGSDIKEEMTVFVFVCVCAAYMKK